eukprot:TRINITY_DN3760_c0_g1_i1.p1 TRINITY_DN3760_c0_g1~~TRINITY_DN3760_c0_g1_i1.p1  ORF type:complete len:568 (-),score=151.94 TRINITY_DN3760_c0_g1_i1:8-1711(-)
MEKSFYLLVFIIFSFYFINVEGINTQIEKNGYSLNDLMNMEKINDIKEILSTEIGNAKYRVVDTKYGQVRGVMKKNYQYFIGIPFASPPIDELRFVAPRSPPNFDGIFNATSFDNSCIQVIPSLLFLTEQSEDCLYLNIWTPADANETSNYPVMVWIHGGEFAEGNGSQYVPIQLIKKSTEKVIVVTLNYRLGKFGFLGLPDMDESDLNAGFLDQRFALQWIQNNIASFGGDNTRVTIFGESAGGTSVSLHLSMKKSWKYFQRAIAESPGFSVDDFDMVFAQSLEFSDRLGCFNHSLECLQNVPLDSILKLKSDPVIFGIPAAGKNYSELNDQPLRLSLEGKLNPVPIIIGHNQYEGDLFITIYAGPKGPMTNETYESLVDLLMPTESLAKWAKKTYGPLRPKYGNWKTLSFIFGDYLITSNSQIALNVSLHNSFEVYSYQFNQESPYSIIKNTSTHFSEVLYLFHEHKFTDNDEIIAQQMVNYWTNFAAFGNPNNKDNFNENNPNLPFWPKYNPISDSPTVMNLLYPKDSNLLFPYLPELCNQWGIHYYYKLPPFPGYHSSLLLDY